VPDKILLVKAKVTTPVFDYIVCILLSALYVLLWSDKRVHNYSFKWMNKHARTVLQFNMQVVIIT
jgi:hypothetical protein